MEHEIRSGGVIAYVHPLKLGLEPTIWRGGLHQIATGLQTIKPVFTLFIGHNDFPPNANADSGNAGGAVGNSSGDGAETGILRRFRIPLDSADVAPGTRWPQVPPLIDFRT